MGDVYELTPQAVPFCKSFRIGWLVDSVVFSRSGEICVYVTLLIFLSCDEKLRRGGGCK
uniref:Uncharacterized protein n=1 Tax=Rhizophora mucronata TaxID=61149 RepID=A0A2P2MST2_RHIMU